MFSFRVFKVSNNASHADHTRMKTHHVTGQSHNTITIRESNTANRAMKIESVTSRGHGLVKFLALSNPELSLTPSRYILKIVNL